MSEPTDKSLYNRVKREIYKKMPKTSAYRSGLLVKTYKERFKKKYGRDLPLFSPNIPLILFTMLSSIVPRQRPA